MWGRWYLPTFLLRNRSLTLMYKASLMVLVILCASLLTMEKLSTLIQGGVLRCSLNLFSKGPCQLNYVLLFTVSMGTLKPVDYPTSLSNLILFLGGHQENVLFFFLKNTEDARQIYSQTSVNKLFIFCTKWRKNVW